MPSVFQSYFECGNYYTLSVSVVSPDNCDSAVSCISSAVELERSVLKIDKKCAVKTKHINGKEVE